MVPPPPLVRALAACFEADPLIDEYDFVPLLTDPAAAAEARPEASFLVEQHKLAISAAAVKPLFREAHAAFQAGTSTDSDMIDVTRALLLVNPDVYTAWNARKRLVGAGAIREAAELAFVDLVFSKHTKKACAWAHRRWCLDQLWGTGEKEHDAGVIDAQELHEMEVTAAVCERFPKNYYAWTHRWWVVEAGAARRRRGAGGGQQLAVGAWLEAQVGFAAAWVERHVWDMSAVSFLQHALRAWAREEETGAVDGRIWGMLVAGTHKLDQCPGHESLWYHRRGLLALWVERRCQASSGIVALASPPPPSTDAYYPPPIERADDMGAQLGWENRMADYYRRGLGPFHAEDGAGLLWEEAARRRQRVCALAHARWVLEMARRHGVDVGGEWARYLGEGLGQLKRDGLFVPQGYGKLVTQVDCWQK